MDSPHEQPGAHAPPTGVPPDGAPAVPPARGRVARRAVAAGLAGAALLGAVAWLLGPRRDPTGPTLVVPPHSAPDDPRRAYAGPFRNIRPDVRYVGDARCAECHPREAESYREHPMGRSLAPVAAWAGRQPYDAAHHDPFPAFDRQFHIERRGDRVWHSQTRADGAGRPLYRLDQEVRYVLGSGQHGCSYLSVHDGYVFQTPVSWFTQKQIWDLSPGFGAAMLVGRPVVGQCLFCHTNHAEPRPGTLNRYVTPVFQGHAIGCERCHGPGERHVETTSARDIVNPGNRKFMTPALRDAVCQQCHLLGEVRVVRRGRGLYDYRPGLPLEQFFATFVRAGREGDSRKALSQMEQMYASRCFRGGTDADRMGCISCHDPHVHVGPERRVAYYRGRCLECHARRGCSAPAAERRAKQDSCIDCHMPRFGLTDIAHTAFTDHRILRRPNTRADPARPLGADGGDLPVRPFHRAASGPPDPEAARDLGIALNELTNQGKLDPHRYRRQARDLLEAAVRRDPRDVDAWEARGQALEQQGLRSEALAAFQRALALAPKRELSLVGAAVAAQELGQIEAAVRSWRAAVDANPWRPEYRQGLAVLLAQQERWDEAVKQCRAWLRLDPGNLEARKLLIDGLRRRGDEAGARAEEKVLEALQP